MLSKDGETPEDVTARMASELSKWLETTDSPDESLSLHARRLLSRCETIRSDFGPIEKSGLRKGPASEMSWFELGSDFALWKSQAFVESDND